MSAILPRGERDSRRSARNEGQTVLQAPHRTHRLMSLRNFSNVVPPILFIFRKQFC
jgi:hypothetical protein